MRIRLNWYCLTIEVKSLFLVIRSDISYSNYSTLITRFYSYNTNMLLPCPDEVKYHHHNHLEMYSFLLIRYYLLPVEILHAIFIFILFKLIISQILLRILQFILELD